MKCKLELTKVDNPVKRSFPDEIHIAQKLILDYRKQGITGTTKSICNEQLLKEMFKKAQNEQSKNNLYILKTRN